MASLCKCLLRVCFEEDSDDSPDQSYDPPTSNRISRLFQSTDPALVDGGGLYTAAAQVETEPSDGTDEEDDNCCQNDNSTTGTSTMSASNPHAVSLKQFWRRFTERFSLEDSAATSTTTATTASRSRRRGTNTTITTTINVQEDSETERVPILTHASSFDSSKEVLTIQTEQVVLPGSELQQEMAKAMACKLADDDDADECVICMGGFDPTNPRMPTLCGCGENKTYFHLPCLYQWVDQAGRNCPQCREKLRWEEF